MAIKLIVVTVIAIGMPLFYVSLWYFIAKDIENAQDELKMHQDLKKYIYYKLAFTLLGLIGGIPAVASSIGHPLPDIWESMGFMLLTISVVCILWIRSIMYRETRRYRRLNQETER